jgi:hypothetical protein
MIRLSQTMVSLAVLDSPQQSLFSLAPCSRAHLPITWRKTAMNKWLKRQKNKALFIYFIIYLSSFQQYNWQFSAFFVVKFIFCSFLPGVSAYFIFILSREIITNFNIKQSILKCDWYNFFLKIISFSKYYKCLIFWYF